MVVEEFHDQKIIYHLNIDEEVNNILMHLSSLKTIKTNRVIKGTTLVGAFYIFSLAFYSYLFHILFAWIFLLLSIGFAAIGLSVEKLQKVFMRAIINKEKQKMNNERKYVFSKEGVDIVTQAGATHNYWSSFVNKGEIENHIYLVRKDNKVILINKNVLSENELLLLRSFIQDIETEQLETENKMSFKMKALVVVTMITIIVSLIYTGIKIGYAEYRKDYNAKGYSYIVTYEDETQIRYLMYDRDNQEGTKTQYVYYKNIKSTDGSWSMMDAEILDMYQYDYESKEVKDLQKTSW